MFLDKNLNPKTGTQSATLRAGVSTSNGAIEILIDRSHFSFERCVEPALERCELLIEFDPSFTTAGYAAMSLPTEIVEAGAQRPPNSRGASIDQIFRLVDDLENLQAKLRPANVVVEITSGRVASISPAARPR